MTAADTDHLTTLTALGLRWDTAGQAGLTGPILDLWSDLDTAFRLLADRWHALDEQYPATMSAELLEGLGYLRSFPHQATFATVLDPADGNIDDFLAGPVIDGGAVALSRPAPITAVLNPAACYHIYPAHRNRELAQPLLVTTRNTCFRREEHYEPLRRQWNFTMREIVCLGTAAETAEFAERARDVVTEFAERLGVPVAWGVATDPFFRPDTDPRHLLQRIMPVKYEGRHDDSAMVSVNRHHEHFGEAMGISRAGAPAHSACLAFGVERWVSAIITRFGTDPVDWPDPVQAAMGAERIREALWE